MNIIIPVLYLFLNTSPALAADTSDNYEKDFSHTIYIVKQQWHTGIVFKKDDIDITEWNEILEFGEYEWIDVGWGDREFYQYPGFDLGLAVQALFYPTESTLRVEGFNFDISRYAEISDLAIEINISEEIFKYLCRFISNTYRKDKEGNLKIFSKKFGGNIIYYDAEYNYHLFNTCNTWIAKGFKESGLDFDTNIVLAEQLFNEASKIGRVIKGEE
jgi:uncharacterized protein (TIGR02117 family)